MSSSLTLALRLVLMTVLFWIGASWFMQKNIKAPIEAALNQAFVRIGAVDNTLAQASNK